MHEGVSSPDRFVVAIGNPALRQRRQQVLEGAGAPVGVVVHPYAYVSPSTQLAPCCVEYSSIVALLSITSPWPEGHAQGR